MKVRVLATSIGLRVDGAGYLATLYWMFVARERQRDLEGREKFSTMARTWNPPTILTVRGAARAARWSSRSSLPSGPPP